MTSGFLELNHILLVLTYSLLPCQLLAESILSLSYLSLINTLASYPYFPVATHINFYMSIEYFALSAYER